jgi:hypothetical protein
LRKTNKREAEFQRRREEMLGKIQRFYNDHPEGSLKLVDRLIIYYQNE